MVSLGSRVSVLALAVSVITGSARPAFAQKQIGVRVGVGALNYIDDDPGRRIMVGPEVCLFCGGRWLSIFHRRCRLLCYQV